MNRLNYQQRIDLYISENRSVSGGKGADTAREAQVRNEKRQDQAFNFQMAQLKKLSTNLEKYLTGDIGFDPKTLALMRSQFLGQNANDFNQARSGVMSALASRGAGGGQVPVGGDYTRGLSALFGTEAQSHAMGLSNIDLQNAQQALANKFNTANVLSGNAATLSSPIATFGAGASNALNDYIKAKNSGFLSSFTNAFGGALGTGLGSFVTGGVGKLGTSVFGGPNG